MLFIAYSYTVKILTRAINADVFSKKKAINHLSFLIKLNADKDNFADAVAKWKRDRDFLLGKRQQLMLSRLLA